MAYDTRAYLEQRLTEVRDDIGRARRAQSYAVGQDLTLARGNLKTMLEEERWLLNELGQLDAAVVAGGTCNRAQFGRPI